MNATFLLRIVTPNRELVREDVEEAQIPGQEGYLGILPGHAPLISVLKPGEIRYQAAKRVRYLAVSWGFVEVLPEQVTVLAEAAEKPEEIDVTRAQAARERAEGRISRPESDTDMDRAMVALQRALVRLQVASRTH